MNPFNLSFEKSISSINNLPPKTLPEISLSGKSNVGKSSLINAIISKKEAHTSKSAGKTSLINFYLGDKFRFVDVPGYGFNTWSKNEETQFNNLTNYYFISNRPNLVLHLIDSRNNLQENDSQMIDFLSQKKLKFCIVLTKIDKLSKSQFNNQFLKLNSQIDRISDKYTEIIPVSSKKKYNIDKLRGFILKNVW